MQAPSARIVQVNRRKVIVSDRHRKAVPLSSRPIHLPSGGGSNYAQIKLLGKGAFGVVYSAKSPTGEVVAIKKVLQDPKYKNRELDILKMLNHENCVRFIGSFKTAGKRPKDVYLNIIMEYMPATLHSYSTQFRQLRQYPPIAFVKLFSFQLFTGLAYLHSLGITHRDLKPENVLLNEERGEVKICDFGSAKMLRPEEASTAYIASRYYRAPELILGCTYYTNAIDVWAAGCIVAELLTAGYPLFEGRSPTDQMSAIVRVLGPPSASDLALLPPNPIVGTMVSQGRTLAAALPNHTPIELRELLSSIFVYNPAKRPTARAILQHHCFEDLIHSGKNLASECPLPPLHR
jgi:glycogen synthase kinase 3 beta